jgi:flagellar basal-body rod modification protein FlgD
MDISGITQTAQSAATTTTDQTKATKSATDSLGNTETFLQLLVAQIKNQDPLNPADGVQFLTQLAQFSELEQTIGIKKEITGLRQDLTAPVTPAVGTTGEDKQ